MIVQIVNDNIYDTDVVIDIAKRKCEVFCTITISQNNPVYTFIKDAKAFRPEEIIATIVSSAGKEIKGFDLFRYSDYSSLRLKDVRINDRYTSIDQFDFLDNILKAFKERIIIAYKYSKDSSRSENLSDKFTLS